MKIRVGSSVPLQTEESYRKQLGDEVEQQAFLEYLEDQVVQTVVSSRPPQFKLSLVLKGVEIDEEEK